MQRQNYKVRVRPAVKSEQTDNGTKTKATYMRKTRPRNPEQVEPTNFFHLEVFFEGESSLDVDHRPETVVIFKNTHPILFDKVRDLVFKENEDGKEVVNTEDNNILSDKTMVLSATLPGLIRRRSCQPYHPTFIDKDGVEKKLMSNRRQPDGSYQKEPAVSTSVSYFLLPQQVTEEEDQIAFAREVHAIKYWVTDTGNDADAKKTAETEDEE